MKGKWLTFLACFLLSAIHAQIITNILQASMVEIYNETIVDLLRSDTRTLDIRTKGNKIILPGVTEMEVEDLKDISKIIKLGEKNRTTAATKMNSTRY